MAIDADNQCQLYSLITSINRNGFDIMRSEITRELDIALL